MKVIDNKQVTDSTLERIAQIGRIDSLRHNVGTILFEIAQIATVAQIGSLECKWPAVPPRKGTWASAIS